MILELHRMTQTSLSTQGLLSVDGSNKFTTLEPPKSDDGPIAAGTYHVIKQWSNRFQKLTPHLQNVPGHTAIEMHVGNYPEDTEDCILVGLTREADAIRDSQMAFNQLMDLTPDEFSLTILDPPPAG
jgi:Steigviridae/Suoliviridae L,D-carboxypeptidase/transpeptidase